MARRTYIRSVMITWLVAFGTLLAAPVASGQTTGAEIRGRVVDESGGVLPGTTIGVTNVDTGAAFMAVAGEQGEFRVPALPPGVYQMKVELSGFASVIRPRVELVIGQIADFEISMKVAGVAESVTVTGESLIVETTKSGVSSVITKDQVASLPILGRAWQELALLTPGAAPPTGSRGAFSAGGTTGRDPNVQVDGTDSNDDTTGSSGLLYSQEAIREFNVMTNRFSAEYGRTQSAAVNVVTKSGTNKFSGSLFGFFRDEALDSEDFFTGETKPYSYRQVGGSFGGPILKDRTHFFVVYENQGESQFSSSTTGYKELDTQEESWRKTNMASGRIDHVINGGHSGFIRGAWSDSKSNGVGSGRTTWQNATGRNQLGYTAGLGENWVISSRVVNEFRFQVNRWFTGSTVNFEGPEYNFPSAILGSSWSNPQGRTEKRFQVRDDVSILLGNHAIKFGVDTFPRVHNSLYIYQYRFGSFYFRTDPPNISDPSTYPQPYLYRLGAGEPTGESNLWIFNTYVQDDWRVTDSLTLNVGIRYDVAPGAAAEGWGLPVDAPGAEYFQPFSTDTNNWGPRVGAAYSLGANGRTVLRGGYGLFQDMFLFNSFIYKALYNNITYYKVEVRNPSLSDPLGGRTIEELKAMQAPGEIQPQDPNVDTPHAHQVSGGFATELGGQMALSADFVYVKGKNQYQWHDINLFENCQNVAGGCQRPDPRFTRILQYQTPASSDYRALLLSLTRRYHNNLGFQVSYTLSKTMSDADDSNSIADAPSDMFIKGIDWGPALTDQRHLLVASATLALPYDFRLSSIFAAGTGLPHKTVAGYDVNGDGSITQDRLPGWTRNSLRAAGVAKLDTRFSRVFRLVGSAQVEAMLEFYNLLNRRNYDSTRYGTVVGSKTFHQPGASTASGYQARRGQVAFRLTF